MTLAIDQRHTHVTRDVTASAPTATRAAPTELGEVAGDAREDSLAGWLPRPMLMPLIDARF